jgi:cell division control protein 6
MVEEVKTLPLQPKILLSSVLMLIREKNEKSFSSGDVYNMYRRLCDRLGLERLSQRRLRDLISELDSFGLINAVVVSTGRHGRTKEISLNVPEELIQPVLFTDHEHILNCFNPQNRNNP